ncbi:MAG: hypothetical protein Q9169_003580 [Polycauliona sp. 2 TL-2023]
MSKQNASIFAGGWTPAKAAILNSTKLPDKTRCKVCHKVKAIANYSNKQQIDFRQRLAGPYGDKLKSPIAEVIVCKQCTPGPVSELICCICNEPKGLEGFSKAQRKDPDLARCLLCVNQHLTEPLAHLDQEDGLEEEFSSDEDTSDMRSTTNPYDGSSYRPGSELNGATSGLRAMDLSEHDDWYSGGKKKSSYAADSDLLGSYSGAAKGKGKGKENISGPYGSPSITGSQRSVQVITGSNKGGNSGFARPSKGGNPGFANPPRGPPQTRPDDIIEKLKAEAPGRVVSYSDASDDDSDGSFGML